MRSSLTILIALTHIWLAVGAPVSNKGNEVEDAEGGKGKDDISRPHIEEYKRYVKQVLDVLEDVPELRDRIRAASEDDITGGKLGEELARIAPAHIRSQLDEAKRQTVARQRLILKKRLQRDMGARQRTDSHDNEIFGKEDIPEFDSNDLRQILISRRQELQKEDKERHDKFVKVEMSKEHQRRELLKKMTEKDRLEAEEKHKFEREKLKNHPKLHHPGSKAQFEEVWEEEDGLERDDFEPRTFFQLHDTSDDGYLDSYELEALFIHEVSKIYGDEETPEMQEEIARMREHVLNEVDKDEDGLVSMDEFMQSTTLQQFNQDDGWEGLDEEELYTDEEMDEYERMLQEEMESMDEESQQLLEKNKSEHPEDVQVVAGDEAHDRAGGQQQHEAQVAGEQAVEQEKHVEQQPETKQENEVHPQQDAQPVQIQEVQAAEAQPHQGQPDDQHKPEEMKQEDKPEEAKQEAHEQPNHPEELKRDTHEQQAEQPKEEEKKE